MSTAANIFSTIKGTQIAGQQLQETKRRSDILQERGRTASRSADIAGKEAATNRMKLNIFQKPVDGKIMPFLKAGMKARGLDVVFRNLFEGIESIHETDENMSTSTSFGFVMPLMDRNRSQILFDLQEELNKEATKHGLKSPRADQIAELMKDVKNEDFIEKFYPPGTPDYLALKAQGDVKQTFTKTTVFDKSGNLNVIQTPVREGTTPLGKGFTKKSPEELAAITSRTLQGDQRLGIAQAGRVRSEKAATERTQKQKVTMAATAGETRVKLDLATTRKEAKTNLSKFNLSSTSEVAYWAEEDVKLGRDKRETRYFKLTEDQKTAGITPSMVQKNAEAKGMTVYAFLVWSGAIKKLTPPGGRE